MRKKYLVCVHGESCSYLFFRDQICMVLFQNYFKTLALSQQNFLLLKYADHRSVHLQILTQVLVRTAWVYRGAASNSMAISTEHIPLIWTDLSSTNQKTNIKGPASKRDWKNF